MNRKNKELTKLILYLFSTLVLIIAISTEGFYIFKDSSIHKEREYINLKEYVDKYKNIDTNEFIGRKILEDIYPWKNKIDLVQEDTTKEHSFNNLNKNLIISDEYIYLSDEIKNSIIIAPTKLTNVNIDHSLIIGINDNEGDINLVNSFLYFQNLINFNNIKSANNSLIGLLNFNNLSMRGYQISLKESYIDIKTI